MRISNETDLTTAAIRLGMSYVGTRNLVVSGRLRGERRYGRWVIDADHLDQLVKQRQNERERRRSP